ncbi:sodium/glucose cotransporter 4 isoform X2 [Lingula anatina]|uniref:Sodium/glucose cotransporter 4 isoform X2 n=1 Tax=Lingula anatina TaxID=7574 RepID=A0A1S3HL46_LINAN|nr:sodium/glucose cotransporter 4 isoform X2 [Lingula anatina]|eukprot:XP_013386747.1 sodium/glucose cotransporter 4 isoform X2 [Lingula anatina]
MSLMYVVTCEAIFVVLLLGWLFVPVYIASGVFTLPEYLQKRFGGSRIQIYLAVMSMIMYIFTKISADLYSGAIFIEQAMNWNLYVAILAILSIAALFTITGGLTAVIWTDFIQTIIMLIGAVALMILGFAEVGGIQGLRESYPNAISNSTKYGNSTCGLPRDDYWNLLRDPVKSDLPWPGIIGLTINSIWYWCADQVIVQRVLASKNYTHAKAGCLFTGYLKILPMFLLVMPGMIARVLFPDTVGCSDPEVCLEVCGSRSGCSNIAYPSLVLNLMPPGARGLMLAVMLSALMTSLTSIFNSSSTIFTMDLWTRIRKKASDVELMIVGRLFVVFLVVVSIIWIPVLKASEGNQLYVYIQEVSSFQQPPICAVFLLAVLWKRINEKGAFAALMIGFLTGMGRFVWEYSYSVPGCGMPGEDPRPSIIKDFHYLYFAIFLFLLTILTAVVVSLMTEPIKDDHLHRLTFFSRNSNKVRIDIDLANSRSDSSESSQGIVELKNTKLVTKDNVVKQDETDTGQAGQGDGQVIMVDEEMKTDVLKNRADHEMTKEKDEKVSLVGDKKNGDQRDMSVTKKNGDVEDPERDVKYEGDRSLPCWKRALQWLCGIESHPEIQLTEEEKKAAEQKHMSLAEDHRWKLFCNFNAVLLMSVAMFLWGFFA